MLVAAAAGASQPHGGPRAPKPEEVFNERLLEQVEEALEECAQEAEAQVNTFEFAKRRKKEPTEEDCGEVVMYDRKGKAVTRRVVLGRKKHAAARVCLEAKLKELIPGRFQLEPRYRYNEQEQTVAYFPPEERHAMTAAELEGTVEPDVVLHAPGNPLIVLYVYDLKFPCPGSNVGRWGRRGEDPFDDSAPTQGDIYAKAFGVTPRIVTPQRGVR